MDDPTSCANNSVFVASKFNCTVQTRSHYNKRNQRMRARRIMVWMGSNIKLQPLGSSCRKKLVKQHQRIMHRQCLVSSSVSVSPISLQKHHL
ncbi:hypothetical protein H5410_000137 [Solanum commersonii]|uniref:Uncharacterized protein n=1 Tax=Solanum commersonii TaxID=4109 RepID=A0A9J6AVF0_SOLCO|nr:hypothetical protein H5410_000137 [Solanum commersonii]